MNNFLARLYSIRNWDDYYENNRSRAITDLRWIPVPNRHDGATFSMIMTHPDGAIIFSAWILMLQIASRCKPRGVLIRGDGQPHNVTSMSAKCRCPDVWFKTAISYLETHTDWLEYKEVEPQTSVGRHPTDAQVPLNRIERTEWKGMEGNGKEDKEVNADASFCADARIVLAYLNEKTNRMGTNRFREIASNLTPIISRLKEDGVELEGVKAMIDRQVKKWTGTDFAQYLCPETLFRRSKFDNYYANREMPVIQANGKTQPKIADHTKGF